MTNIDWEEPPPNRRGHHPRVGKYAAFATALRENPGQWAVWSRNTSASQASNLRRGRILGFDPPGDYEFRFVSEPETQGRRGTIYARYIGEVTDD